MGSDNYEGKTLEHLEHMRMKNTFGAYAHEQKTSVASMYVKMRFFHMHLNNTFGTYAHKNSCGTYAHKSSCT